MPLVALRGTAATSRCEEGSVAAVPTLDTLSWFALTFTWAFVAAFVGDPFEGAVADWAVVAVVLAGFRSISRPVLDQRSRPASATSATSHTANSGGENSRDLFFLVLGLRGRRDGGDAGRAERRPAVAVALVFPVLAFWRVKGLPGVQDQTVSSNASGR